MLQAFLLKILPFEYVRVHAVDVRHGIIFRLVVRCFLLCGSSSCELFKDRLCDLLVNTVGGGGDEDSEGGGGQKWLCRRR